MTVREFSLTIEGQQMNVCYRPNRFAGYGHFEFRSPYEPPRRIPVSETGYRSHFAPPQAVEESNSPEAYAELVVKALMNSQKSEADDPDEQQLVLF